MNLYTDISKHKNQSVVTLDTVNVKNNDSAYVSNININISNINYNTNNKSYSNNNITYNPVTVIANIDNGYKCVDNIDTNNNSNENSGQGSITENSDSHGVNFDVAILIPTTQMLSMIPIAIIGGMLLRMVLESEENR